MVLLQEHQPSDRRHWLGHGRECEYGTERNRRIFCRIELAVPLVVDELIVACDGDHRAGHTFSGRLAGEEIVQPGQTCCENSTSFGFAPRNGAAFATFLLCARPDAVAAVAAHSGIFPLSYQRSPAPAHKAPLFVIWGEKDEFSPAASDTSMK